MSYESVQSVLSQMRNSSYVSPTEKLFALGRRAFFLGIDLQGNLPAEVQKGWEFAFFSCADGVALEDYRAAAAFVEAVGV